MRRRYLVAQQRQPTLRMGLAQPLVQADARQGRIGKPVADDEVGPELAADLGGGLGVGAGADTVCRKAIAFQQLPGEILYCRDRVNDEETQWC